MLSEKSIKRFAAEFHTSEMNVIREYLQHLFLSYLYQQTESKQLAFKGGTALRILFGSPRFSEDLDFTSANKMYHIRKMLETTVLALQKESLHCKCDDSKPTSGGYFARYVFDMYGNNIAIEINISLRDPVPPHPMLVTTPLIPAYQCMVLPIDKLVWEKLDALLRRKKPRDFFDLYFLLRERRGLNEMVALKKKLLEQTELLDTRFLKRELKLFLPATHHGILTDFPKLLRSELERL